MTLITSSSDAENLSMTLVAEFDAAPERVWNVWADPRKLERWYGPSPYPAYFTRYEFEPGGQCRYHMTGPENFLHHGWWRIDALDAPAGSSSSTASPAMTASPCRVSSRSAASSRSSRSPPGLA